MPDKTPDPAGQHRLVLLDHGPVPDALRRLCDAAGLMPEVAQGRAALPGATHDGLPVAVVLSAPVAHLARALADGRTPGAALEGLRATVGAGLAALQKAGNQVVVLERGLLAQRPMLAVERLADPWGLAPGLVLSAAPSASAPPAILQVLAEALLRASGPARAAVQALEAFCGSVPALSEDTALRACADLAALGDEAGQARAEALAARRPPLRREGAPPARTFALLVGVSDYTLLDHGKGGVLGTSSLRGARNDVRSMAALTRLMGVPATGKSLTLRVMDFYRCDGRQINENWVCLDYGHLFDQMGINLLTLPT